MEDLQELDEIRGLPKRSRRGGRRGGGCGVTVVISALTAVVFSVGTVALLQRYPIPTLVASAGAGSAAEDAPAGEVRVPELVGVPARVAPRIVEGWGLRTEVAEERASEDVAAGDVILQSHLAGSRVERGTTIRLVVSTGPARGAVPAVVGQRVEEARAALQQAGLSAGAVTQGGEGEAGRVTAATPAPGTQVEPASAVALTVAPSGAPVPRVVGMPLRRARSRLEEAGFHVGATHRRYNPDHGPFVVLGQDPEAGALLASGGAVSLVVNQGP